MTEGILRRTTDVLHEDKMKTAGILQKIKKALAETQKWEPIETDKGEVIFSQDQIDKHCSMLQKIINQLASEG